MMIYPFSLYVKLFMTHYTSLAVKRDILARLSQETQKILRQRAFYVGVRPIRADKGTGQDN
jgi:hypothetical protein